MAGAPPNNQPYGQQLSPMPQYVPMPRRKGSMAPRVWGVLLLVLGGIGLLTFAADLAALLGGGIDPSTFAFGMSDEGKAEIDQMVRTLAEESRSRWTAWLNVGAEVSIALLSLVAGFFLIIRPKPAGRKLALARGLLVLLLLPVYGYELMGEIDRSKEMTYRMQQIQIEDALKKEQAANPKITPEEMEQRRAEIKEVLESMQPFVGVAGIVGVIFAVLGILVINALLLFFMTRPAVKDYMDNIGQHADHPIPNYDPSMGLHAGPPQPARPPTPPQTPPV